MEEADNSFCGWLNDLAAEEKQTAGVKWLSPNSTQYSYGNCDMIGDVGGSTVVVAGLFVVVVVGSAVVVSVVVGACVDVVLAVDVVEATLEVTTSS